MRSDDGGRPRRPHGFTLIEMLVVGAIVALLASIAYPSYVDFIRRSKRTEAIALLMETMQSQERHYSRRNRYFSFTREANPDRLRWHSAVHPSRSSHEIAARPCSGETLVSCVELLALPGTAAVDSSFFDPACGTLSLDSRGNRSPASPQCWQ
jgi:type IV pilus assembly protein PilE